MGDLPSFDEASGGLPSFEDATKPQPSTLGSIAHGLVSSVPVAGPIADAYFNDGPLNKIAKAFGQSFQQNYGGHTVDPDLEKELQHYGVFNDFKDGKTNTLKSANEAWMRPVLAAANLNNPVTWAQAGYAGLQAAGAATEEAGTQLKSAATALQQRVGGQLGEAVATPVGAAGELLGSLPSGFLPELHAPELHTARAEGVIGEGESGYFGTKPPTADQLHDRAEATSQMPPEPAPRPDVHTVARQIAPDTFNSYDALNIQRQAFRDQLASLSEKSPSNPRAAELQTNIDTILSKVGGDEDRLTNAAAEHLERSRTALETTPLKTDTPEMAELRQKLQETDVQMRDLAPNVATAYRLADEHLNGPPEASEQNARVERRETRLGAAQEVTDGIAKQLMDLGKPEEEARPQAALVAAYYDTRGQRTGRTAKEVFEQEHPEVRSATEAEETASKGKVKGKLALGQARNTLVMFKSSNASTFLHEMGHQFLENLRKDASGPAATAETAVDSAIVHKWLKADEGKPLTNAMHEKWARGFERYLMEGRAPTKELAEVFAKFKDWLTKIYRIVSNLRAPVTNDIRDVFSRLLSDEPDYRGVTLTGDEEGATTEGLKADQAPNLEPDPLVHASELPTVPKDTPQTPQDGMSYNQTDYIDKTGKINFDNIASDEQMNNFLKAWAEQNNNFVKSRGLGLTKSDIISSAEMFGTTARNMSRNLEKLKKLTVDSKVPLAVRVKALEDYLRQNTQRLMDAAQEDNPYALADAALKQLDAMRTFAGVKTSWAQVGHALQKANVEAKQSELIAELFQKSGKTPEQLMKDAARIRQLDTPAKIADYVKKMMKPSLGEMLEEFFKSNLISGPLTHLQYTIGNKLFAFLQAGPESFAASVIGDIREGITGKISEPGGRVYHGESAHGMYAFLFGQRDGLKAMWDSFKAGQTLPLPGEDFATTPFTASKAIPDFKYFPLGSIIRAAGERMIAPIHSADRTVNFLVGKSMFSYRDAVDEGLKPGTTAFNSRLAELQNDPSAELLEKSRDYATEAALMGKSGDLVRRIHSLTNWEPEMLEDSFLGRTKPIAFISPFVSVNGNILRKALMERTPIGYFSRDARGVNGTLAQDTAIARATVGTAIWGTLAGLYIEGIVNPSAPDDYKEANLSKMANGLPNSIRVGEMSYAFDRLGVMGAQMSIGTDLMHAIKNGYDHHSITEAGTQIFLSILNHTMSEGFLSSIADTMKAVDEHERYGVNWVKNFITSGFIPYSIGMTQIASQVDPFARQAKSFTDAIMARIPFLSEHLQPKIDIFGQPVPNKEFVGVYSLQVQNDPVVQALEGNGYFPAPVSKKIRGVELTPEQYHDYATKAGILLHQLLSPVVTSPYFQSLTPLAKHSAIEGAVRQSRDTAACTLLADPRNINIINEATGNLATLCGNRK